MNARVKKTSQYYRADIVDQWTAILPAPVAPFIIENQTKLEIQRMQKIDTTSFSK
jgi:hypothetical protein